MLARKFAVPFVLLVLLGSFCTTNVQAGDKTAGAEAFVDSMAQRAIDFLGDESITHDQRQAKFKKLLKSSFDMKTIGRFALGRYWRTSNDAQRKEYLKLFENMVVEVYSSRFGEYKGQTVEVRSSRADGETDFIVTSYVLPVGSGSEIQVDWRVRHKGGQYKIIDVIVAGVSMSVTQRSDFASVIQRGGGEVNVLLAHLRSE
ncbi:MAG: hypothetical protein DHS20C02_13450 [Micavibrio sp.]|nr:MAG: hypothetical protein DHS20C02_13450 [Micavibrio sp.]